LASDRRYLTLFTFKQNEPGNVSQFDLDVFVVVYSEIKSFSSRFGLSNLISVRYRFR
jgi:hypothetical protein